MSTGRRRTRAGLRSPRDELAESTAHGQVYLRRLRSAQLNLSILALVASVSSKAAVAHMAAQSGVKLAVVQPYLNDSRAAAIVATHYGEPLELARTQVAQAEQAEISTGF